MLEKLSKFLDKASGFLAPRKGLLPILGILFVLVNFFLEAAPIDGWVVSTNLFLHLGVIIAILGFMIAWAL